LLPVGVTVTDGVNLPVTVTEDVPVAVA
jgi:hypothetical protein